MEQPRDLTCLGEENVESTSLERAESQPSLPSTETGGYPSVDRLYDVGTARGRSGFSWFAEMSSGSQ